MVKCVKVYLNYIDAQELSYKDFCRAAWDLQRQVRAAKNIATKDIEKIIVKRLGANPEPTEVS